MRKIKLYAVIALMWLLVVAKWLQGPDINPDIETEEQETKMQMYQYADMESIQETEHIILNLKKEEPEWEVYEDIPLDSDLQIHMQEQCQERGISYEFALALMETESTFQVDAVGDGGESVGLFQINKFHWERMKDIGLDVNDPKDNITAGLTILQELIEKNEDEYWVIICYKAGEGRGQELYDAGMFTTKDYNCSEICRRAEELERSHGK